MNLFGKNTKRLLSSILSASMIFGLLTVGVSAEEEYDWNEGSSVQPSTTYEVQVTDEERQAIHDAVDALAGDPGEKGVFYPSDLDHTTLVGGLTTGSSYNSISYGRGAAGSTPTEYPFKVPNTEANKNEGDRKTAKYEWVVQLAKDLGFDTVVQRQDDKYVYVEIGDPDAPEMVMALSHLDSPTASNREGGNLDRWKDANGDLDPEAYYNAFVRDGWIYGAGVQDDSGPTLATLYAAAALKNAGMLSDRRIRIVMGSYEDGSPGVPTVQDTLNYMDIPYYTGNPGFYDNWAYKSLNREETPIAGYTSDSRFPVIVGNTRNMTNKVLGYDLSGDGNNFGLKNLFVNVTLREDDPTLEDIVYGSASQIASRANFVLDVSGVATTAVYPVQKAIKAAAEAMGWTFSYFPNTAPTLSGGKATSGYVNNVSAYHDVMNNTLVIDINTDVPMEYPTPQYAPNAVVWGMYLLQQALPVENKLKTAADGIVDLFFQDGVEGEAYIGKYILDESLLRNEDNGAPNLTIAIGQITDKNLEAASNTYYNAETEELQLRLGVRSLYPNAEQYDKAVEQFMTAVESKGFEFYTLNKDGSHTAAFSAFSNPTLYLSHDNPLTALQFASYGASMACDQEAFDDVYDLLGISSPLGTTGGTLASNYLNKMTAFGAIIPGNERWWHTANERISVKSIIQMTKLMADGMLEMARYSGPAGAQLMWADIAGLNANRAELDLLDITVGTYVDASEKVPATALGEDDLLLAATSFEIPMWTGRGNASKTDAAFKLGHEDGGVYLPITDKDYITNTFVMPMRLEFKVSKPEEISDKAWNEAIENNLEGFKFSIMKNGKSIPLTLGENDNAADYYSIRQNGDNVYVAVNLAIVDGTYGSGAVQTVLADSKTDLYDLNDEWEATHENPFPERGQVEQRGFFIISDGVRDAEFHSPDAIYVTTEKKPECVVNFVYPEGIEDSETTVELYKGFPTSASYTLDQMIARGQLTEVAPVTEGNDSAYYITEPGTYSYHISGEGYYNILKLVHISEEELDAGKMDITVVGGKLGSRPDEVFSDGYQPTVMPEKAPDSYKMDARDAMLVLWNDEILEQFSMDNTTGHKPYNTPAFDGTDAAHEFTSQDEMLAFMKDRDAKSDVMHLYSAGTTPNYKFDIPLAIFTSSEIPADATLEEAAQIVRENGKATVWYQTQIHPNEPASGEGALVIADLFASDSETQALLDDVNVVIVPRINPDGAYLFSRATYDGFDMNRDHMSLKAAELAQLHTAYRLFMAEVVIDGHEFTFYGANAAGYMNNADDVETTPATSLNNDPAVTELALSFSGQAFKDATDAGLRVYHYGTTVNNPIGRAYFGLYECLSFLVETRGIGAGRTNLERRVFSQETVIMSYIKSTAEHAEEVKATVAAARANTIEQGKTYDEDDVLALYQTKSGNTFTEYTSTRYQFNMDGTRHENASYENVALSLNDTIARGRIRPTAYVIPADAENIDKILYIMDNQGAEYYKLDSGVSATLEQYYYVGQRGSNAKDIEADLRPATKVTFENGAYVFPMDQVAANVIAMLVEPDVTDSVGYDGTLFQYGVVTYDETTKNFPLYRYTGNDPRETLKNPECIVNFVYPEDIKDSETTVELYKGFPTSSSYTLTQMIDKGQLTEIAPMTEGNDSVYRITEPGTYSYHISGEGYYNILKLVHISEEELDAGKMDITVVGGKLGSRPDEVFSDGYQPTVMPEKAPDSYKMDARDAMLVLWNDEILEQFSMDNTTGHKPYNTPAFDGTDAAHEFTSQDEMLAFMKDRDAKSDVMHLYSAGTTPNYKFDIPLAIFTSSEIPADATLEEAAQIVRENGKATVWYQTQIHPNEPASGEGALVIADLFASDSETQALLDDVNVVIVPRINPDGAYLFSRATYDGFDMNRDHMSLKAAELAQLHTAYRLFMAEVVIDGHEFTFYGANAAGYMNNADDVETTPATSLNNDPAVTELALSFSGQAFKDATDAGLRVYHYGTTVNNPIGRAYFGLYECLSFLVETRGIGAGRTNLERRVFSQETVIMSYIKSTAEHAEEVKATVAAARANTIEQGKTYDEDDVLALYQTKSGNTFTEYTSTRYQFNMDGTRHENASYENVALSLNDTIARGRIRPTAYVIPADAENIDKILYIMDNQGAEYYKLDSGVSATLEQYYYVGQRGSNAKDIEADLRPATKVTFENGAYVFPMDQVAANVIAMLVEPDVTDSVGYDGTLFQYGVVTYDETTKNFPLYRYTGNDPRETLVNKPEASDFFVDVPSNEWYTDAVNFVVDNGLMVGTSDVTFSPDETLSREMLVQILWAKAGKPACEFEMTFADVADGQWYTEAVRWAASEGIVSGYSTTEFGVGDSVTREQLAAILFKFAQVTGMDTSNALETLDFADADSITEYAVPAIKWACANGIISGKPGNVLDPTGESTRAEAAQMLMRWSMI